MSRSRLALIFSTLGIFVLACLPVLAQEEYIQVNATVGSVISGPSSDPVTDSNDDNDSDSDSNNKKKKKNPLPIGQTASISVEPANLNGATFTTIGDNLQFTVSKPAFKGSTNIQNANISLIFNFGGFTLRSVTQANSAGEWQWASPEEFPNGSFELTVVATHPTEGSIQAKTSLSFSVLATSSLSPWNQFLGSGNSGFIELFLRIEDQYKQVVPGSNVVANLQIIDMSTSGTPKSVIIEYTLVDEEGIVILSQKETIAVGSGTRVSFSKVFYTQPDIKEGRYRLIAKTAFQNTLAVATAEFVVQGKSELLFGQNGKIDYSVILKGIAVILVTFLFLLYFEFVRFLKVKNRIRMVTSKVFKKFF